MDGRGVGYGKIILFGEHFVVHGAPAIAAGISNAVVVDVKRSDKNRIITDQRVSEELSLAGISNVQSSMGISEKYDVHMGGDLPCYGGLGSSAAFCVALARALAKDKHMSLSNEEVNKHAYEGEKAFHGNPSGIDNLMATYRGVMEFARGKRPQNDKITKIEVGKPLDLVISFTGKYSPTPKMVAAVGKFKEDDESEFAQLMDEYMELEMKGKHALEKGQLDVIGQLMNENQGLLSELGVSDETNDSIVSMAAKDGALGSKLTGGGGGGCCITLANDEESAKRICEKIGKEGFESFTSRISKS